MNYTIIRFFNTGYAQIETNGKTYDTSAHHAELELHNARKEYKKEVYKEYSNRDFEYFFN